MFCKKKHRKDKPKTNKNDHMEWEGENTVQGIKMGLRCC